MCLHGQLPKNTLTVSECWWVLAWGTGRCGPATGPPAPARPAQSLCSILEQVGFSTPLYCSFPRPNKPSTLLPLAACVTLVPVASAAAPQVFHPATARMARRALVPLRRLPHRDGPPLPRPGSLRCHRTGRCPGGCRETPPCCEEGAKCRGGGTVRNWQCCCRRWCGGWCRRCGSR
jgi:hypothetical protein